MEAALPLHKPSVRATGDSLVIESLVVADATAAQIVRDAEDPAARVTDAIEIGARVLDRENSGAQAEFVKAELEKASREVDGALVERTRTLAERFDTKVEEVFGAESGHLTKALERHFSDGSSEAVQHRVKEAVAEFLAASREDLRKQFSATDGSNPLAEFRSSTVQAIEGAQERQDKNLRALFGQLTELKVELEALRGEKQKLEELAVERERGTAKGRDYEEEVAAALDAIATGQGDDCDAVGDFAGESGKTGDVVVAIDGCKGLPRGRLVFEAKDRRLTKPKAMEELDRALQQRGADYAVLVVPTEEELPANTGSLREYQGDKLMVVWSPGESPVALELAYGLARAKVLMAAGDDDGVDTAAIRDLTERAVQALANARSVKTNLTNASNGIDKAREGLEALEAQVRGYLMQIETAASGQQSL
ncbi:MAG: hypothetical protein H0V29_12470 [Thermoleophilaceae bacterium]|nr:hypothetical protein [Thermoleophilaceae bacterium]